MNTMRARLRRSSSTSRRGVLYWLRKVLRNKTTCLLLTFFAISAFGVLGVALKSSREEEVANLGGDDQDEPRVNAAPAIGIANEIAAAEEPVEVFDAAAGGAGQGPAADQSNGGLNGEVLARPAYVDLSNLEFYTDLPGMVDRSGKFVLHPFHQVADAWESLR
jgi:hypothetical protein